MVRKNFALISVALVILLLGAVVPWGSTQTASACSGSLGPLRNLGFEEGLKYWTVVSKPDAVKVVGTEGHNGFKCYADMNITISPFMGSEMLRLGTPKNISQSQNKGANTVSQTFNSTSDTLLFAFWLFSWESRRYDVFSFDLKNSRGKSVGNVTAPDGSPLLIHMPDGTKINLSTFPRTWSLDVGNRGQFLNTGWVQVKISGIPIGQPLTLTFSVGGTANTAYATWAYFDEGNKPPVAGNKPPVAKFAFGPQLPLEGDIVQLMDGSYDPDPGDAIASWHWDVAWTDSANVTWHSSSDLQNPFFVPPDEQSKYSVSLTVTDTHDASTTVTSGHMSTDGYLYNPGDHLPVPALVVENAAPKVNALNIEALPGQTITLIGRFIDPGWLDTHSATWNFTDASLTATNVTLEEDNSAYVDTGMVTGNVTLPEGAQPGDIFAGTLTVRDNDGGTGSDSFNITVVANDPNSSHEPNDNLTSAPQLASDGIYLSYIQSQGDVDLFEVVGPDGQPLPAGSELLVTLKDLPADYDLVLLSQQPSDVAPFQRSPFQRSAFEASPFQRSPFQRSPFQMTPFQRSPFQRSPFQRSPFQMTPFQRSPFQRSPFQRSPFQRSSFDEYPLSEMGFTGLDGNNIGGGDISLSELGLGGIDGNVTVVGFSANRGLNNETVLASSALDGTRFFIAVVGYNGAFSTAPYSLQIETSRPLDIAGWLKDNGFTYQAPVTSYDNSQSGYTDNSTPAVIFNSTSPLTLFITQRERIEGLYGAGNWTALVGNLTALARHPAIQGKIISVPIGMYQYLDNNTDNVTALDEVAANIRDIIQKELTSNPSIKYVVLVGSDDIIPYYRVPDETIISNERDYLMSSFLVPGSPLFYSILGGWNLSDDYYVDAQPIPWQGRSLYVPDLPIGRLVETPQEIIGTAKAFLSSNGTLNPATALVTGYDFFADGAQAVADTLSGAGLTTDTLISSNWTSADLQSEFLNQTHDINNINAHFAHYAALSASGYATNNMNNFLSSKEVATAGNATAPALANKLVFSMGCHAGLNVPDRAADSADPGMGIDPALDFPQAMAMERAVYVASTGFGLGDDEGIGGTERLMGVFAENLMQDNVTVGGALVLAKQQYLSSLSAMTVYDEKSSIQFTLYGLPQYRVGSSAALSSTASLSMLSQVTGIALSTTEQPQLSLTIIDGDTSSTTTYSLQEVDTAAGSYFTADGNYQSTAFRAIQPRVVIPITPSTDGSVVHGILLQDGEFTDITNFNPVITLPTRDWVENTTEAQVLLPTFWPAELATVNSLETGGNLTQTLVVIPTQFRPNDSTNSSEVTGTERLYTNLTFELLRSNSNDYEPPVVSRVDLRPGGDEGSINVTVAASDPSGIARIVVLNFDDGIVTSFEFEPGDLPLSGTFVIQIPVAPADARLVVQVADGAGNVATATGKGALMRVIEVDAEQVYLGNHYDLSTGDSLSSGVMGYPVFLQATVHDFTSLTAPVSFVWDLGDGTTLSGLLAPEELQTVEVTIDESGNAIFTVQHTYSNTSELTATVKIADANGGNGTDDVVLYLRD